MIPGQIQQILAGQGDPAVLQQALQSNLIAPQQVQDQPAQADIETPDQSQSDTPPSGGASMGAQMEAKKPGFLSRLFGNANKAADSDPQAASKPGGWAKALVAGVSGAAQGVMHDFSDAQGDAPGLQRLAQVAGNRTARIQAQAQLQRKNKQEDVENDDKHQAAQALLAHSKLDQLKEQRLAHVAGVDAIDRSIASGQDELKQTTEGEYGAPIYQRDVTSEEFNRFLQDKKKEDPNSRVEQFHAVATGKREDPSQPDGYRTLYTIVGVPKSQKLTQDFVNSVNPGLSAEEKLTPGDNEVPGAYAAWLRQKSNTKLTQDAAIKSTRDNAELNDLTTEQKLDQARSLKAMGSDWSTGLSVGGNNTQKALEYVQSLKNDDGTPKYPKAAQTAMAIYGGPKEWDTIQKTDNNNKIKQQEANANDVKAKADLMKADAAEKKAGKQEAQDAAFAATADLTPKQYFGTLPTAKQDTYKAIQEGRQTPLRLQGRNGELTDAGQEFMRAYPNYDITKGKAFGQVRTDFEDKKVADTITGYGTAMGHARLMFDNTGPMSYIPGTKENAKYDGDAIYLATEVARALDPNGVATDSKIKEQLEALTTHNPNTRKVKLQNAMDILESKYGSLKQRWQNALPDPENYNPPMPGISQEAQDDFTYVSSGGKENPGAERKAAQSQQAQKIQANNNKLAVAQLPSAAVQQVQKLPEGKMITFANGQSWQMVNGQPTLVSKPQGQ